MKKILTLVLVSCALLVAVTSSSALAEPEQKREPVLGDLAWGDPIAKLGEASTPSDRFAWETGVFFSPQCPQLMVGQLRPDRASVPGLFSQTSVLYCFFEDRLAYIRVRSYRSTLETKSLLLSMYGKPTVEGPYSASWTKGETTIKYNGGSEGRYPTFILYSEPLMKLHTEAWEAQREQSGFG